MTSMNPNEPDSSEGRPPVESAPPLYPPPPPGAHGGYAPPPPPPARKSSVMQRLLTSVITSVVILSLVMNLYFIIIFAKMVTGPIESVYQKGDANNRIVIVPIKGMIDDSTSAYVREAITALREKEPKAVILRVDSGGGAVGASDRIFHQLQKFKEDTGVPIVASFGSIAASGGYYISAGADSIIAEPTCVTGSIGVMANVVTIPGMLEKIGVTPEVMAAKQSPEKTVANDIMRPWNAEDREVLQHLLDWSYDRFVEVVEEGRDGKMTAEEIKSAATGRVFTAAEAVDAKLVDKLGYLDDAIAEAKSQAKLSADVKPFVTVIQPRQGLLGQLAGGASRQSSLLALDTDTIRRWAAELTAPRLEYTMSPVR